MQVGIDREKAYGKYATIGDISYKVHGQYSDREITNLHPEFGALYKKLEIVVPLSISRAGDYLVTVEYRFSKQGLRHNTRMKTAKRTLDAKNHMVKIEFFANEAGGSYGHWSPGAVDGNARVQLSYLASKKGTLDEQTVTKFVGTKETQF